MKRPTKPSSGHSCLSDRQRHTQVILLILPVPCHHEAMRNGKGLTPRGMQAPGLSGHMTTVIWPWPCNIAYLVRRNIWASQPVLLVSQLAPERYIWEFCQSNKKVYTLTKMWGCSVINWRVMKPLCDYTLETYTWRPHHNLSEGTV